MAMLRDEMFGEPTQLSPTDPNINRLTAQRIAQPEQPLSYTGGSPTFDERAGGAQLGGGF